MGHSWCEMDPKGAREQELRIERRNRIWKEIENVPLSFFAVGEFLVLRRFIEDGASEADLAVLEQKIAMFCRNCGANIKENPNHRC